MEIEEIRRRLEEATSPWEREYYIDLEAMEWGQLIQAASIVGDWDFQLAQMIENGALPDHPLRQGNIYRYLLDD